MPAILEPVQSTGTRTRKRSSIGTMVGVDIGCHSIKVAQFESTLAGTRLRLNRVVPHAAPLDPRDPFACLDQIAATLGRAWSSRNRWFPIPASCSLSMSLTRFCSVELPASDGTSELPESDVVDAFLAETDPTSGPWVIESWPSQAEATPRGPRAFATIGVEEGFASAISNVLWKHGLNCRVLDAMPFAMTRTLSYMGFVPQSQAGPVAVIDWGYSAMTLTIVVNNTPCFTRLIRDGELRTLAESVKKSLDVDADQCRHLIEMYGLSGAGMFASEQSDLRSMMADVASPYQRRLNEELQRTWLFLQHLPFQTPVRVVLMGGGAAMKNSVSVVKQAIPLPTEVWRIPDSMSSASSGETSSSLFGPVLALAGMAGER